MRGWIGATAALLWFGLTGAAPDPGAKRFVDELYATYKRTGHPPADAAVLTRELAGLIAADDRVANKAGEPNLIDYVVLCSCQDDVGIAARTTLKTQTAIAATVTVALSFEGHAAKPFELRLAKGDRGWRVADVVTFESGARSSLLKTLKDGLRDGA